VPTKLASLLAPLAAVLLGAALGAACTQTAQPLPEISRFHFPTGMAIDTSYALGTQPPGTRAHFLYVAGNSNFDQAASRGVVMAVDLDGYGPASTGLMPPALAVDGGDWDGTPLQFPDVGDAGTMNLDGGFVFTDSLGGEMRLSPTSAGGQRLVLASRGQNTLGFIDVDPGGATLTCVDGDAGQDCLNPNSSPELIVPGSNGGNEILDVFALSYPVQMQLQGGGLGPPELFVGNLRNLSTAVSSVAGAPNPYTTTTSSSTTITQAFVIRQSVDDPTCNIAEYAGEVPAAGVMGLQGPPGTLYSILTGRFSGLTDANIRVLTLPPPSCPVPNPIADQLPVNATPATQVIDLSQILKETDGRGLALSSSKDRVFALSIGPDSLVVLRIDGTAPTSLLIHPSSVVPLPNGPSEMVVIPRTAPNGSPVGDLVAVSCPGANVLAFYDDEIGSVTAALPGVGDEPFAVSTAPRTLGTGPSATLLPGVRLFVTAFGSGQVAVVDLPDPLDATTARVIAMLGTFEDTTASPVNPLTNQILTLPYGYGGAPGGI
jgi:hypothetical protein